jgi:pheromone a factor receptor
MSYPNGIYSAFLFLAFLATTIPLPWHMQAWNTGTCLYMIWTALASLNQFINSIIWTGNAINWSPSWCDVSAKFMVGANFAIPACSLCINRRLYHIASVTTVTVTKKEKMRSMLVDIAIGVGIPIIGMALQYINQGHRFDIYEDIGCYPFNYNTPMYYGLQVVPLYIIGITSAVYCILSIRAFNQRRVQRKELLSAYSNLNANRYFRLMILAGCDLLFTIPALTWGVVSNVKFGVAPWVSWADTHWGFSQVNQYPALVWKANSAVKASLETSRWSIIVCAFIFFILFGFADEARKNYKLAFDSLAKRVGYSTVRTTSTISSFGGGKSTGSGGHMPIFVRRETKSQFDSLNSFSDVSFMDAGGALGAHGEKRLSVMIPNRDSTLLNAKGIYTPTSPSSASTSSLSPSDRDAIAIPEPAAVRGDRHIEISSARRSSSVSSLDIPVVEPHQDASDRV